MSTRSNTGSTGNAESNEARRRRIAAVFGEVLPDTTSDERDAGGPDDRGDGDSWWRAQVPPHHG